MGVSYCTQSRASSTPFDKDFFLAGDLLLPLIRLSLLFVDFKDESMAAEGAGSSPSAPLLSCSGSQREDNLLPDGVLRIEDEEEEEDFTDSLVGKDVETSMAVESWSSP